MNLEHIRARYLREPFPRRLAALAANLARACSFLASGRNLETVRALLVESAHFIEWTVPEAPLDLRGQLAELQVRLAVWSHRLEKSGGVSQDMGPELRRWSNDLLQRSGLAA